MRRLLPSKKETAIFAAIAVVCALIVLSGSKPDIRLALLTMPIFVAAGIMGMRRNRRLVRIAARERRRNQRD